MTKGQVSRRAETSFAALAASFAGDGEVVLAGGKGFGAGTLKVRGKIFAFVSSQGKFVVKLPRDRVTELVARGWGQAFDSGNRRQMKEWLAMDEPHDQWRAHQRRRFLTACPWGPNHRTVYEPAHFREERPEVIHDLIRTQPLGLLITARSGGLIANLIPWCFYPTEGEHGVLRGHVARANAQWREIESGLDCLVVFQGPDAYITPNWYQTKQDTGKVVPTWNYATVQVQGRAIARPDPAWLRRQVGDLTDAQEQRFPRPWRVDDAPPDFLAAQLQAIVGVEIAITSIAGKWKMSQNRNEPDRAGVVSGLAAEGTEKAAAVAKLIQG